MRRALVIASMSVILLAACSSTSTSSSGTSTTTADPLAGITVPDSFSPIAVTPISSATFPWLGSDQKYHVSYDLQLTNGSRLPATLDKVDVVDAHDPTRVVGSLSGTQLVDPECPYGDCNRLRNLPSSNATDTTIPTQESRALMIDLVFDSLDQAPVAVLHHLYVTGASGPGSKAPGPVDYLAAPFDTSAGTPRVIGPPVKGDRWVAMNGCCGMGWPHRPSLLPVNGKLNNSQRFAIDWVQMNEAGDLYSGDKTQNESYVYYGADIYAVADGTVTSTLDEVDAGIPGTLPANDPVLAAKLTLATVDGNHIVLDIGGGVYAMYAHLLKGSLLVKPGDTVKKGDKIARLGNTGNSNAAHMHFQLMAGPSLFEADAVPYVIDTFTYRGQVSPATLAAADDYLTGPLIDGPLPAGEPRTAQLPMALAIVDFPTS